MSQRLDDHEWGQEVVAVNLGQDLHDVLLAVLLLAGKVGQGLHPQVGVLGPGGVRGQRS